MKKLVTAALLIMAVGPSFAGAQTDDSLYVLEVRLVIDRHAAIDSILAALPRAGFAPVAVNAPYLIMASPLDKAGTTVRIHLLGTSDGTRVLLSAFAVQGVSGAGTSFQGSGASSIRGGGVQSVERGSRAGRDSWERMENLRYVLERIM